MKKNRRYKILMAVGVALVVLSVGTLLVSTISQRSAVARARDLVVQLRLLMPPIHSAGLDDRVNTVMASMEVEGESFCGILEIPAYNKDLPICDAWGDARLQRYPCRYTGSIYDRSLVICGSDNAGQFDFMKQITGGDVLYVTDMTGGRYRYQVADVLRTKEFDFDKMSALQYDLMLYARNSFSLDYTVVFCKIG